MGNYPDPKRDGAGTGGSSGGPASSITLADSNGNFDSATTVEAGLEAVANRVYSPGKLTNTHSPVALFDFNGDLVDDSATGEDLVVTGTESYVVVPGTGQRSLYLDGSTMLKCAANAAHQLTGDCTFQILMRLESVLSVTMLAHVGYPSESPEAENTLISLYNSGDDLIVQSEFGGSGSNINYTVADHRLPTHQDFLLTAVRESNQVSVYFNQHQVGSTSTGLGAPTGGSSSYLGVGDIFLSGRHPTGVLHSLRLIPSALTAAQIATSAQEVGLAL